MPRAIRDAQGIFLWSARYKIRNAEGSHFPREYSRAPVSNSAKAISNCDRALRTALIDIESRGQVHQRDCAQHHHDYAGRSGTNHNAGQNRYTSGKLRQSHKISNHGGHLRKYRKTQGPGPPNAPERIALR
jgi:hypothetical protein